MSEWENGQRPVETEAERAARERKEKVAGFRLHIDPNAMDLPTEAVPSRPVPPAAKPAPEEKPAQKSAAAVSAIAAAVAAKMDAEGDIGEWERPTEEPVKEPVKEPLTAMELAERILNGQPEPEPEEQPLPPVEPPVATQPEPGNDTDTPVHILDEEDEPQDDPNAPVHIDEAEEYEEEEKKRLTYTGIIFYVVCVLAVSCVLAFIGVTWALDLLGLNKTEREVDVQIPRGATTKQVADALHENGLVSHPFVFRVFSKLTHADGQYQSGVFTLASNEGYQGIISDLQSVGERETVDVTVPEGYNILEIAELLEESEVCGAQEFLKELEEGDYSDYDFIAAIPEIGAGTDHPYRIYRLEGYLFPDTYTFYKACSPEAVVEKFFDNFETRVDTKLKSGIKAMGLTLDEAVTLASIVQREADNTDDMAKIARVFHNRLAHLDAYPFLQSDPTAEYVQNFQPDAGKDNPTAQAYSTYVCKGLPTGPISNPGLAALRAVANPNADPDIINCYYFATDTSVDPTVTYYSETFEEHMSICYRHDIGVHAS